MSVEDCGNVALPPWSYFISAIDAEQEDASDPASRIAALLLAKLADYVVPGECRHCSYNMCLFYFIIYIIYACIILVTKITYKSVCLYVGSACSTAKGLLLYYFALLVRKGQ